MNLLGHIYYAHDKKKTCFNGTYLDNSIQLIVLLTLQFF